MITCMQKKVKIKFNSIQNDREITCMQKRMNFKSNSMQEAMVVTCMQMEGQAEAYSCRPDVSIGPIFSLYF